MKKNFILTLNQSKHKPVLTYQLNSQTFDHLRKTFKTHTVSLIIGEWQQPDGKNGAPNYCVPMRYLLSKYKWLQKSLKLVMVALL